MSRRVLMHVCIYVCPLQIEDILSCRSFKSKHIAVYKHYFGLSYSSRNQLLYAKECVNVHT